MVVYTPKFVSRADITRIAKFLWQHLKYHTRGMYDVHISHAWCVCHKGITRTKKYLAHITPLWLSASPCGGLLSTLCTIRNTICP